uniref:Uncharacterized protein n=1 Tax=Globodera rostochiensis TaxID=31243 RepID=A0A914IF04_GLORO
MSTTTTTGGGSVEIGVPIRIEGVQPQQQHQQQHGQDGGAVPKHQQRQQHKQPPSVVERLRQLEAEMDAEAAAGAFRLPDDRELTVRLADFLADRYPDADLQLTVSSVRRTITTKQQYETETPGMVGLPLEQLQELQRKLMAKISAQPFEHAKSAEKGEEIEEKQEEWARRGPEDVQQSESVEEGVGPTDEAGTIVSKKRMHVLATSQSQVQGLDGFQPQHSPSGIPVLQQHRTEDDSALSTTTPASSVRDRIAHFEALKRAEAAASRVPGAVAERTPTRERPPSRGEEDEAARRRFGWRPPTAERRLLRRESEEAAEPVKSKLVEEGEASVGIKHEQIIVTTTSTKSIGSPVEEITKKSTELVEELQSVPEVQHKYEEGKVYAAHEEHQKCEEPEVQAVPEEQPKYGKEEVPAVRDEMPKYEEAEVQAVPEESPKDDSDAFRVEEAHHDIIQKAASELTELVELETTQLMRVEPIITVEPPSGVYEESPPESPREVKEVEKELEEFQTDEEKRNTGHPEERVPPVHVAEQKEEAQKEEETVHAEEENQQISEETKLLEQHSEPSKAAVADVPQREEVLNGKHVSLDEKWTETPQKEVGAVLKGTISKSEFEGEYMPFGAEEKWAETPKKEGEYVPFGAETPRRDENVSVAGEIEDVSAPSVKEESLNKKIVITEAVQQEQLETEMEKEEPIPKDVEDEHIQVRKISMDTVPKGQEIIQEEVARAEHPAMFVTTALERVDNEVKGQTVPMTASELLEQVPPVAAPSTTAEPQAEHFVVEKTSPTISKRFQPNSESFLTDSDAEVAVLEDEDVEHELNHRQELMEQMRGEEPSPAEQLQQIQEDQLRQAEMESPVTKIVEEQPENAIVQELRQTHYEQQPVVWLETVPAEQTPYEAEEVAQKQTLHRFEVEQELPTSSSTDSLKPWFSAALRGIAGTVTEAAATATTDRGSEEEQVQEEHERNLELEDSLAFEDQHPGENGIEYRDDMIFRPEEVSAQIAKIEPRPREQQGKEKAEGGWPELEPSADVKPWRSEEEEYYLPEENTPEAAIREEEIPAEVFSEEELMIPEEVPETMFPEEELMIPEEVVPEEKASEFPEAELSVPEEVTLQKSVPAAVYPEEELMIPKKVPETMFPEEELMIPEEVVPEEKSSEFPEAELSVPEEVTLQKGVPAAVYPEEELLIPEKVAPEERAPETMFPEEELIIPKEVTLQKSVPAAVYPEEELMISKEVPETMLPEEELMIPEEVTPEERVPETLFPEEELMIPEEVTPEERVPETMFPEEELMIPEEVMPEESVPAPVFPEEELMIPEEVTPEEKASEFPEAELLVPEEVTLQKSVPAAVFLEEESMIPEEVMPEERVPETIFPEEESMIPEEVTPDERVPETMFPEEDLMIPEEVMPEESVPAAVFPEDELMIPAEVTPEKALTVQKTELPEAKVLEEKSPEAESTEDVRDELIAEKLLVEQERLSGVILVEMPEERHEDQRQQVSDEQSNLLVTENVPRQIAHSLAEQQKPKAAQPPPLSPLNSEEQELSGGMDEGSEEGSTHTVILRPKPISDDGEQQQQQVEQIEQTKTRSLYGAITPDQEEFPVEDERSRTPSTPVMSAARWKSMDEQTSPSPIIEITPAPDEPEEVEAELRDVQNPPGTIHDKELKDPEGVKPEELASFDDRELEAAEEEAPADHRVFETSQKETFIDQCIAKFETEEVGDEHLLLVDTEMVVMEDEPSPVHSPLNRSPVPPEYYSDEEAKLKEQTEIQAVTASTEDAQETVADYDANITFSQLKGEEQSFASKFPIEESMTEDEQAQTLPTTEELIEAEEKRLEHDVLESEEVVAREDEVEGVSAPKREEGWTQSFEGVVELAESPHTDHYLDEDLVESEDVEFFKHRDDADVQGKVEKVSETTGDDTKVVYDELEQEIDSMERSGTEYGEETAEDHGTQPEVSVFREDEAVTEEQPERPSLTESKDVQEIEAAPAEKAQHLVDRMERMEELRDIDQQQSLIKPTEDELRHVEETRALCIVTERQAHQLVEEALERVLGDDMSSLRSYVGTPSSDSHKESGRSLGGRIEGAESREEVREWPEDVHDTPATGLEEEGPPHPKASPCGEPENENEEWEMVSGQEVDAKSPTEQQMPKEVQAVHGQSENADVSDYELIEKEESGNAESTEFGQSNLTTEQLRPKHEASEKAEPTEEVYKTTYTSEFGTVFEKDVVKTEQDNDDVHAAQAVSESEMVEKPLKDAETESFGTKSTTYRSDFRLGQEVAEESANEFGQPQQRDVSSGQIGDEPEMETMPKELMDSREKELSLLLEDEEAVKYEEEDDDDEEDQELAQIQYDAEKEELESDEEEDDYEVEDLANKSAECAAEQQSTSTATFLGLSPIFRRPKSPIPPPAAPTPPQTRQQTVDQQAQAVHGEEEDEELFLLHEGPSKEPINIIDVDDDEDEPPNKVLAEKHFEQPTTEKEEQRAPSACFKEEIPSDEQSAELLSGSASVGSVGSSPAKRHRTSQEIAGSANGSLLEFERIEHEIHDVHRGAEQSDVSPRNEKAREEIAAAVAAARGSAESISGSQSSLTEFEQLEREVMRDAQAAEDAAAAVMMLSDIREESDEGMLEDEKAVDEEAEDEAVQIEEDERMSTGADEEEDELANKQPDQQMASSCKVDDDQHCQIKSEPGHSSHKEEYLTTEKVIAESAMLNSVDSLEMSKSDQQQYKQHSELAELHMDTSVDSLEFGVKMTAEQQQQQLLVERDSLSSAQSQHELDVFSRKSEQEMSSPETLLPMTRGNGNGSATDVGSVQTVTSQERAPLHSRTEQEVQEHAPCLPAASMGGGNGNGSPAADEDDGYDECTVYKTTINGADAQRRIVRTVTTRVRDPVHTRVRFVDTQDEQTVQALLNTAEGSGVQSEEREQVDEQGNVSRFRTLVERGGTPPTRI